MPPKPSQVELDTEVVNFDRTYRLITNFLTNYEKLGAGHQTIPVTQGRLKLLDSYWNSNQKSSSLIELWASTKEREELPYFREMMADAVETKYLVAYDFLNTKLAELEVLTSSASPTTSATTQAIGPNVSEDEVRLPAITLPSFSGVITEWVTFRDLFTSLVKGRVNLSNVKKLHYLKSSLTGEAVHVLSHIKVSDGNFDVAWQSLVDHYEDERTIVNSHFQLLFSIKAVGDNPAVGLKQLRVTYSETLNALRALNRPVDQWNDILVYYLVEKLDKESRILWEAHLGDAKPYPTLEQLTKFIDTRIRSLGAGGSSFEGGKNKKAYSKAVCMQNGTTIKASCPSCFQDTHKLMNCSQFKNLSVSDRYNFAKQHNICLNCLHKGHSVINCKSRFTCLQCKRKHHTLLHRAGDNHNSNSSTPNVVTNSTQNLVSDDPVTQTHVQVMSHNTCSDQLILLATTRITIDSGTGRKTIVRALVDQGSDASFISENLAQSLKLPRERVHARVVGIGGKQEMHNIVKTVANCNISPVSRTEPVLKIRALVLPRITAYSPRSLASSELLEFNQTGISLADPEPSSRDPIDLLIGADLYPKIILEGVHKNRACSLVAQNSIFGWIISGSIPVTHNPVSVDVHHSQLHKLNSTLQSFWEIEDLPLPNVKTQEEVQCEDHFSKTHYRDESGRYTVRLPFKQGPPIDIGESKTIALSCLHSVERRFSQNSELHAQYVEFMKDYENLGHMTVVSESILDAQSVVLPHHAVIKPDSVTTKLRVVFNASAHTSNGYSLNDHLLAGPKLQPDLIPILLRWCNVRYVLSADIAQMYRQILVNPLDRMYQLILWRSHKMDPIHCYTLNTVTYGTKSAPFLAQRVINQLVQDEGHNFPLAIPILNQDRYVDDVMFGDDDESRAFEKREQVIQCLARGGFHLRKWASNSPSLLKGIDVSNHGLALDVSAGSEEVVKVLGLRWNPANDSFHVKINVSSSTTVTKRNLLSIIAHFFDPLGWLSPVIITSKILIQGLWKLKLDWDDPLPNSITATWVKYYNELPLLTTLVIPRWTGYSSSLSSVQVHGFCDASEQAYAAVVYVVLKSNDSVQISLLLAKTKVAPLKQLTIPRLELCAALLLSRCIQTVLSSLHITIDTINCWTDSTIVLSWLKKSPSTLKQFVASRTASIQNRVPDAIWRHVPTEDNPADIASRGTIPSKFLQHPLWWQGPKWLANDSGFWPDQSFLTSFSTSLETKSIAIVQGMHTLSALKNTWSLADNVSSWPRLLRITAYVFRFIRRCRYPDVAHREPLLQVAEIQSSLLFWIREVQSNQFPDEISALSQGMKVPKGSPLLSLDPYLDDSNLLRVGGRLRHADLPFEQKHPIALKNHRIVELILRQVHRDTLHGGVQLMLRLVRERYWVLKARRLISSLNQKCVICARERVKPGVQFMANLPIPRITQSRPFSHCGVDYAGPILVRNTAGRGRTSHKAYIALFICLATRAIHLELVHDYTSAAFIVALERFTSRRGLPLIMYSDNGTTFQGADKELTHAFRQICNDATIHDFLSKDSISWKFLPPFAPHFGGLWEAGVKSVKHHLKRVLRTATPTIEEFVTLLCNIEACLNSRPIAPLTDDISSYAALTPGHFLIGTALKSVPKPSVLNLNESRLDRWQCMRRKYEEFWKLWVHDYLHSLQQRSKWRVRTENIKVGDLVLLRHINLPPTKWELGRVLQCFPDAENLVRTVKVKTAKSVFIRPITQLCKLPVT